VEKELKRYAPARVVRNKKKQGGRTKPSMLISLFTAKWYVIHSFADVVRNEYAISVDASFSLTPKRSLALGSILFDASCS
jgi:hypothetical protein